MDTKDNPQSDVAFVTSLRLPRSEHDLLVQMAQREHRSLSGQMRYLIAQAAAAEPTERAA